MIVFIGSLVATGYLHSDMGNTAFAIISLLLGHYCCTPSDSIRVSPTRKRGELVPVSNRLPCQRAGNSCFANTALQIVAHISPFHDLFDPTLNPLEKDDKDVEEGSFINRQQVQTLGMKLINKILQGEGVTKKELEKFITIPFLRSPMTREAIVLLRETPIFSSVNSSISKQEGGIYPSYVHIWNWYNQR